MIALIPIVVAPSPHSSCGAMTFATCKNADIHALMLTGRQTKKYTDRQRNRQTDRQTEIYTDRQADTLRV